MSVCVHRMTDLFCLHIIHHLLLIFAAHPAFQGAIAGKAPRKAHVNRRKALGNGGGCDPGSKIAFGCGMLWVSSPWMQGIDRINAGCTVENCWEVPMSFWMIKQGKLQCNQGAWDEKSWTDENGMMQKQWLVVPYQRGIPAAQIHLKVFLQSRINGAGKRNGY